MDTGDPRQDEAPTAASGGKAGKKKKKQGKTMRLDQFLAGNDRNSAPKSQNWANLSENPEDEAEAPSIRFDRSLLPTAPKAAMGAEVDLSQIPINGPFSAYVGNLSYEAKEEDLEEFFSKLEVDMVRIISDAGRPRGYAYVDFKTREALLEALTYHSREYMGRAIKVDLATEKNSEGGRSGGFGSSRSNEPDRTEGDWRRREPASLDNDRDSGRGGYGDRDRGFGDRDRGFGDRDRGFGDRDRGFDRDRGGFGDRDRGFGDRDRGFGDRDRGFDRDRGGFGDRDRGFDRDRGSDRDWGHGGFGDRDRGFGGDRDRGFGDRDRDRGFGGNRRGGGGYDRSFGDRGGDYGDRSSRGYGFNRDREEGGPRSGGGFDDRYGGGGGGQRDDYYRGRRDDGFERRPTSRDGSQENRDGQKERPVLKLQPRSKPVENKENQASSRSSIFGAAKPVDTYAREREIENKLKKKEVEEPSRMSRRRVDSEGSDQDRRNSGDRRIGEGRRDSGEGRRDSGERRRDNGERRYSGDRRSGEGMAPTSRRDNEHSRHSDDAGSGGEQALRSPTSDKSPDQTAKMVPAPPPKDNPWTRKRDVNETSPPNASNNAARPTLSEYRAPEKDNAPSKPNAWGRGPPRTDHTSERRHPSDSARGNVSYSKEHSESSRPLKEKAIPKHYDEMPKYEENKSKDFSNENKFAFLRDEDQEGNSNSEQEDVAS